MRVRGWLKLALRLKDRVSDINVRVVETLVFPLILGIDWIDVTGALVYSEGGFGMVQLRERPGAPVQVLVLDIADQRPEKVTYDQPVDVDAVNTLTVSDSTSGANWLNTVIPPLGIGVYHGTAVDTDSRTHGRARGVSSFRAGATRGRCGGSSDQPRLFGPSRMRVDHTGLRFDCPRRPTAHPRIEHGSPTVALETGISRGHYRATHEFGDLGRGAWTVGDVIRQCGQQRSVPPGIYPDWNRVERSATR